MASLITMLVITRAPESSAESSGTPPPTRMASVLAKREVLTPRISDPSQGMRSNRTCQRRLAAARRHAYSHRPPDDDRDEIRPSRAQEVAQPDQRASQQRQALSRLPEHPYDLGHHVDQQAGDDHDRHDRDQDGVKQRESGFLFQRLARIEIIGEMLQDGRQRARFLAAMHRSE